MGRSHGPVPGPLFQVKRMSESRCGVKEEASQACPALCSLLSARTRLGSPGRALGVRAWDEPLRAAMFSAEHRLSFAPRPQLGPHGGAGLAGASVWLWGSLWEQQPAGGDGGGAHHQVPREQMACRATE